MPPVPAFAPAGAVDRAAAEAFAAASLPSAEEEVWRYSRIGDLDLAPEAPWRCPEGCTAFQPRMADVNWSHGTLVTPPTPPAPDGEGIAELLDAAEDIVNAVAPDILAEIRAADAAQAKKDAGLRRFIPGRKKKQ